MDIPVIIAGTKSDKKIEENEKRIKRMCENEDLLYIETSSKNNQNINILFESVTELILHEYRLFGNEIIELFRSIDNKEPKEILFDSNENNWNINTSTFDQQIYEKSDLLFLIQDENNKVFGCYIYSTISTINATLTDQDCFVFTFSIDSNHSEVKKPIKVDKYPIIHSQYAFKIYPKESDILFVIGDGWFGGKDICVYKEQYKSKSYCYPTCFDYGNKRNGLLGKDGKSNYFVPSRIIVVQF